MEQVKKKADWRGIIFLQAIIVIYTFSSVCGKMATNGNEFIPGCLLFISCLILYCLLFTRCCGSKDLNVLILTNRIPNRSVAIIWSMVWSALIFRERNYRGKYNRDHDYYYWHDVGEYRC